MFNHLLFHFSRNWNFFHSRFASNYSGCATRTLNANIGPFALSRKVGSGAREVSSVHRLFPLTAKEKKTNPGVNGQIWSSVSRSYFAVETMPMHVLLRLCKLFHKECCNIAQTCFFSGEPPFKGVCSTYQSPIRGIWNLITRLFFVCAYQSQLYLFTVFLRKKFYFFSHEYLTFSWPNYREIFKAITTYNKYSHISKGCPPGTLIMLSRLIILIPFGEQRSSKNEYGDHGLHYSA
jgi:hypothetical protein